MEVKSKLMVTNEKIKEKGKKEGKNE